GTVTGLAVNRALDAEMAFVTDAWLIPKVTGTVTGDDVNRLFDAATALATLCCEIPNRTGTVTPLSASPCAAARPAVNSERFSVSRASILPASKDIGTHRRPVSRCPTVPLSTPPDQTHPPRCPPAGARTRPHPPTPHR